MATVFQSFKRDDQIEVTALPLVGVLDTLYVLTNVTPNTLWRWDGVAYREISSVNYEKVVRVTTAGYTVLANDSVIRLLPGFTGTVALPTAASSFDVTTNIGRKITIINHSGGIRATSITYRTGSARTTTVLPNNAEITIMSDGTDWFIKSN